MSGRCAPWRGSGGAVWSGSAEAAQCPGERGGLHYLWFGLGLLAITGLTLGLGRWARIGLGWFPLWAILRAVVQLSAVALLLRGILAVPWTVAAFVVLMMSTASWTAAG